LAALHERARTGRGRVIDAALFDVQVAMLANQASNQLVGQTRPTRMGNAHPNIVPYQVFASADGHVVLAVGNDGQFARFCEVAGHPDVARDERFATNPMRVQHRTVLVPLLSQWLLERTTEQWVSQLEAAAVPCSPILSIDQVLEHPQVQARGLCLPAAGNTPPMVANPMRLDGLRPLSPLPPPALGADQARWLPTVHEPLSR
jgi:crotonobetainyl-CoA:carnitine CoA-transferase CaiB-like acyl-CoA transferase